MLTLDASRPGAIWALLLWVELCVVLGYVLIVGVIAPVAEWVVAPCTQRSSNGMDQSG